MNKRILIDFDNRISGDSTWYSTSILPNTLDIQDLKYVRRNKDHYYLQFNFEEVKQKERQGFKIHISANLDNYEKILNTIYRFCRENKLTFKYISNKNELINNFSGNTTLWSSGKFITIYSQQKCFKSIIEKLYLLPELDGCNGIYLLTDRRYKDSNIIFYRYGILKADGDRNIYDSEGNYLYTDYLTPKYKLPEHIQEPFPNNKDDISSHSKYLYVKYIPIKNKYKKASGSVFCVKNKIDGKEYILKNARPNFSDGEITQVERLKSEERKLIELSDFDFFPKRIESFEENENYFLVETLMKGQTISQFRAKNLPKYKEKSRILPDSFQILEIIKDMCRKLHLLHENDVFLGDISENNILINEKNNTVSFVDVEQTEVNVSSKNVSSFYRTPRYFDEQTATLAPLQQDVQQLGYVIMAMFCRANSFLMVDPTGRKTTEFFREFAKLYDIPKELVNIPLSLIRHPSNESLKSVLKVQLSTNEITEDIENEENYFPSRLLTELKKTYYSGVLDSVISNTADIKDHYFNSKEDVIFSSKINDLYLKALYDRDLDIDIFDQTQIAAAIRELVNQLTGKMVSEIKSLNLSTYLSILNCYLQCNNIDHTIDNKKKNVEIILDHIFENYR